FASGSQQAATPMGGSGSFVAFAHTGESSQISRVQTNPGTTSTGAALSMIGQAPAQPKKINTVIVVLGVALAIAAGALLAVYSNRLFPSGNTGPTPNGTASAVSQVGPTGGVGIAGTASTGGLAVPGTAAGVGTGVVDGIPAPNTIHLQVKGVPFGGQVLLDGMPLAPTPQGYAVPGDGKVHTLTGVANGQSHEARIKLDHDQAVDLTIPAKQPSRAGAGGGGSKHQGGGGSGKHPDNGSSTPDLGY
ncbi:MAG: hypothetical protein ABI551_06420, partial [Polyangiaceae bacterium]